MTYEEAFKVIGVQVPELVKPENVRIVRHEVMLPDAEFERLLKSGWKMKQKRGPCAPDEVVLFEFVATRDSEAGPIDPETGGFYQGKRPEEGA